MQVEKECYSDNTMGIFASYPSFAETSTVTLAMDQMLGTALLLIIILAVTDDNNMNIQSSLVPITIGLGLTAIHLRSVLSLKFYILLDPPSFHFQFWT